MSANQSKRSVAKPQSRKRPKTTLGTEKDLMLLAVSPRIRFRVGLLAKHLGFSERHFGRLFCKQMHCSPSTWIKRVEAEEAARLMKPGVRMKEIAAKLFREHASSFTRGFTRQAHATPSKYHQQRMSQSQHNAQKH
jgi:AraC-like DNA-binding protein